MATLLYQQSNIEVFWDEQEHWLRVNWIGYQTLSEIERDREQILRFFLAKNASTVLNDNTRVEGLWIGGEELGGKDWFSSMRASGLTLIAWVYSPARFKQIALESTLGAGPPSLARVFSSVEEATKWLRIQQTRHKALTHRIVLPPGLRRS